GRSATRRCPWSPSPRPRRTAENRLRPRVPSTLHPCPQLGRRGDGVRSHAPTDCGSESPDVRRTGHDEAPPAEPADDVLVAALATDRSALGPIYDRYGGLVYGLARAILQSQEE